MKIKPLLISASLVTSLVLSTILFSACTPKETDNQTPPKKDTTQQTPSKSDAVTTASIVNNEAAFLKAISKDGTWIIATLKDLSFSENLTLDGQFKNKDVLARKIALYTQDDNKNVTARFTLKAPKLTVKSENARIQSGTFIGDVYVEANGFQLVDAKVDGNIYFSSEDFKASYKKDDKSSVTKNIEVKK